MHVVITGASSGIGEALVLEFARSGAAITLVSRRRELLEKLAAASGARTHVVAADLSDFAHATDWIPGAVAALGPIDVLINNAGVQIVGPAAELDMAAARASFDLDLVVPIALTRAVLPAMLARRQGCIVDVASMAALAPLPGMWTYNAAKAGLAAASESLRGELRRSGVHVVTVYPGPVETPLARAAYEKYGGERGAARMLPKGTPDVLAQKIRRAVERRRPRVIYPGVYALSRHFPALVRWFVDRFTPPAVSE